jgi:fido (protein-threonine AMPylation protein)
MSEDPLFEADDAATPLTAEEKQGLIPSYITLRRELNEAEQINVTSAEQTAFARSRNVLDERYLRRLHKSMYRDVWKWAGEFRKSERNIGVDHFRIPLEEPVRNFVCEAYHAT